MGSADVSDRYGSAAVWDQYFEGLRASGRDLDWRDQWTAAFIPLLRDEGSRLVLDLGCGTANEVRQLTEFGIDAVGLDFAGVALRHAREKGVVAPLVQADMARPLPFSDGAFDAVMSNAAMHMFSDRITRELVAELRRILRPDGLLMLHVSSIAQRELQDKLGLPVAELERDFVLNADGGTDHFFSADYLRSILSEWRLMLLEHVPITRTQTGEPFKYVWRAVARR